MPNGDREKAAAEMSKTRGRIAAGITDPDERKNFIARQGWLEGWTRDPRGYTRVGYSPGVQRELERENRRYTRR
jgi:hypothetical protein